jgi:hypothetical protein
MHTYSIYTILGIQLLPLLCVHASYHYYFATIADNATDVVARAASIFALYNHTLYTAIAHHNVL